jgi:hypothetical protein
MSLDGTAPAGHHGLSVMELVAMEVVHAHLLGPVTITLDTIFHGTVTGDVTVLGGVHLDLLGTVATSWSRTAERLAFAAW